MLNLINQSKQKMPRQFIQTCVQEIFKNLDRIYGKKMKLSELELSIVFLERGPAQKLNFQFRKKKYPTDILSFPGDCEDNFGELVLCPSILVKQAHDHSLSFRQELAYMLTHGILHLLGLDHENSKKEAEIMFKIQDLIFDRLCKKIC